jgi:hypothetical protein
MKTYWGTRGITLPFLISALDKGRGSASTPSHFNMGAKASGTHWIEGWLGPRASVAAVEGKKKSYLLGIKPRTSSL